MPFSARGDLRATARCLHSGPDCGSIFLRRVVPVLWTPRLESRVRPIRIDTRSRGEVLPARPASSGSCPRGRYRALTLGSLRRKSSATESMATVSCEAKTLAAQWLPNEGEAITPPSCAWLDTSPSSMLEQVCRPMLVPHQFPPDSCTTPRGSPSSRIRATGWARRFRSLEVPEPNDSWP